MVTAINLTAIIISCIALLSSLAAIVLVLAQKWSTHKIEWRPLVAEVATEEAEDAIKNIEEDEDKILSEALQMQRGNKKKKEEDPLDSILETSNF